MAYKSILERCSEEKIYLKDLEGSEFSLASGYITTGSLQVVDGILVPTWRGFEEIDRRRQLKLKIELEKYKKANPAPEVKKEFNELENQQFEREANTLAGVIFVLLLVFIGMIFLISGC